MSRRARRLLALLVLLSGVALVPFVRPASGGHLLAFVLVLAGGLWLIDLFAPTDEDVRRVTLDEACALLDAQQEARR